MADAKKVFHGFSAVESLRRLADFGRVFLCLVPLIAIQQFQLDKAILAALHECRRILMSNRHHDGGFLVLAVCLATGLSSCRDRGFLTPPTQGFAAGLNSVAADQEPRFSYDGRYLVFASNRQSHRGVYLYDRQLNRLIDLPGLNQLTTIQDQPDISGDGRYIVYISQERGKPDVFVYDRQTFQSELITEDILGEVRHPTISGNGRFVAFESNRSGQWDIEIYDRGSDVEISLPMLQSAPMESPKIP